MRLLSSVFILCAGSLFIKKSFEVFPHHHPLDLNLRSGSTWFPCCFTAAIWVCSLYTALDWQTYPTEKTWERKGPFFRTTFLFVFLFLNGLKRNRENKKHLGVQIQLWRDKCTWVAIKSDFKWIICFLNTFSRESFEMNVFWYWSFEKNHRYIKYGTFFLPYLELVQIWDS